MSKNVVFFSSCAIFVCALLIFLRSTVSPSRPPQAAARQLRNKRLLVFGDSHAGGLNPYLKAIAAQAGVSDYRCEFENGTRIDQWADGWLATPVEQFKPEVAFVILGTNDAKMRPDSGATEANIRKIVSQLNGIDLFWILPPKVPEHNRYSLSNSRLSEIAAEIRQASAGRFYDTYDNSDALIFSFARPRPDIHPRNYDVWADNIVRAYLQPNPSSP